MVARDLKFSKFDVKRLDKVFELIIALRHQLLGLLLCEDAYFVHISVFEIWKQDHKDLL
jgi:hypothetical protein